MSVGLLFRVLLPAENSSLVTLAFAEGWGYSPTIPIRVCAAQRGRVLRTLDLERGIHFPDFFWKGV